MNKDLLIKALKTFIQGFVGYLVSVAILPEDTDKYVQVLVIGAVAAGLSALMNIDYKKIEATDEVVTAEPVVEDAVDTEGGEPDVQ